MSTDEAKGRVKRAAGELSDNEKLKHEGTVDKAAAKAKETVDKAAEQGERSARETLNPPAAARARVGPVPSEPQAR